MFFKIATKLSTFIVRPANSLISSTINDYDQKLGVSSVSLKNRVGTPSLLVSIAQFHAPQCGVILGS